MTLLAVTDAFAASIDVPARCLFNSTVDVVQTKKYGGPHILNTIYVTEMKLCVYNDYDLKG